MAITLPKQFMVILRKTDGSYVMASEVFLNPSWGQTDAEAYAATIATGTGSSATVWQSITTQSVTISGGSGTTTTTVTKNSHAS